MCIRDRHISMVLFIPKYIAIIIGVIPKFIVSIIESICIPNLFSSSFLLNFLATTPSYKSNPPC